MRERERESYQQPSRRMKDEFGAFHPEVESGGWQDQEDGNSFNSTGRRSNNTKSTQLKDKDLTIMNEKEKLVRRSNNHDRPKELILSPNAYQQQVDFAEDGSSFRGWRKTVPVQDVSRGKFDTVCSMFCLI